MGGGHLRSLPAKWVPTNSHFNLYHRQFWTPLSDLHGALAVLAVLAGTCTVLVQYMSLLCGDKETRVVRNNLALRNNFPDTCGCALA
jgi:hypothetical protein